jgi:hypothetical protein
MNRRQRLKRSATLGVVAAGAASLPVNVLRHSAPRSLKVTPNLATQLPSQVRSPRLLTAAFRLRFSFRTVR